MGMLALVRGAIATRCCSGCGVCGLELACWALQSAPARCCCGWCLRVLLWKWCVCWCALELRCSCRVLQVAAGRVLLDRSCYSLLECCVRIVLLLGAASECCRQSGVCDLELACWCRCSVPQQGVAVKVACVVWNWFAGVTAGCCCRALLQLQRAVVGLVCALWSWHFGVAARSRGCCCQSAACTLEVASSCSSRRLQSVPFLSFFWVLLLDWCVRCGAGWLVSVRGAGAECYCQGAVYILGIWVL